MSCEDLKRSAAIICKHISYQNVRSCALRDLPLEPEDSGWQFLCGVENHSDRRGQVWALQEVAALDPTLSNILDTEPKVSFERSTVDMPWRSVPHANEGKEL